MFRFHYEGENAIKQTIENGNIRMLVPFTTPDEFGYHLYVVLEENADGSIDNHAFVLSQNSIPVYKNLDSWVFEQSKVYKFEDGQLSNPLQKKLMARYNGNDYDAATLCKNAIINPPTDTPVCIDWYWTTWDGDTGEIIDQTFLFTDCGGYGGGGSTGTGTNADNDPPQDVTTDQTWTVEDRVTGGTPWKVTSTETINGKKFRYRSSQFTSITHKSSQLVAPNNFATWYQGTVSANLNDQYSATARVSGDVVFVNQSYPSYPSRRKSYTWISWNMIW